MSREDPQFKLRLPASLKADLQESSIENGRSLNAEIVHRLEASFGATDSLSRASAGELIDELIKRLPAGSINLTIDESRKDES